MQNSYEEIRDDLKFVADKLTASGFEYKAYNHGIQYNAEDINGITQTYYPTTGRIVFHRSNSRTDNATFSIEDSSADTFIDYLNHPEDIQDFFLD